MSQFHTVNKHSVYSFVLAGSKAAFVLRKLDVYELYVDQAIILENHWQKKLRKILPRKYNHKTFYLLFFHFFSVILRMKLSY